MKYNKYKKKLALSIAVIMFLVILIGAIGPVVYGETDNLVDLDIQFISEDGQILKGSKGISYKLSYINILFNTDFRVGANKEKDIKIIQNGSLVGENYKFEIDNTNGIIKFTLKDGPPNETNMHPFRLRPHTLYNIYIPEGTLVNNQGQYNKAIYYTFVTKAKDGPGAGTIYENDILVRINPSNNETWVDYKEGKIEFEFVDDIGLVSGFHQNIGQYLEVISEPIDPSIPSYNMPPSYQYEESIDNFNVYTYSNKLVLSHKNGALKDFAKYTVRLKDNSLYLKNSSFASSPNSKIFNISEDNNDYEEIIFYTDNMLERTYPNNNQENVEVEPTIEFEFKYPVNIKDKTKVTISSDGKEFALDNGDIYLSTRLGTNNKILLLNVNDHAGKKIFPLRRHTVYKVTIEEDALEFKDYSNIIDNKSIVNKTIDLYFITRGEGEFPVPTTYSSNINKSDDIRYLNHDDKEIIMSGDKVTNLSKDGSIYIHFEETIRADKQGDILSKTKLYKMPKADSTKYDDTGNIYDETVIYNLYDFIKEDVNKVIIGNKGSKIFPNTIKVDDFIDGNTYIESVAMNNNDYDIDKFKRLEDLTYMDEIPVGKVEIINNNILKVTPKYDLEASNKYGLWVDKRVIEDVNRFNMEKDLKLTFWTKADNKNTVANWLKSSETRAENIKENSQAPYKSYTLFGAPQYGPENPMVLDLDREVIPKAQDDILEQTPDDARNTRRISYDALQRIDLVDEYPTKIDIEIEKQIKKEEMRNEERSKALLEAKAKWDSEDNEILFDEEKFIEEFDEEFDKEFEVLWEESLKEQTMIEREKTLRIDKYEFFYYFENGVKKTKIYLYPNKELERGKHYRLLVRDNTLQTRSGNNVESLEVNFVVEGKWDGVKGVYSLENNNPKVTDIWSEGEWIFKLFGHNFHEKIEKIVLEPLEGRATGHDPIIIGKEDIEFRSVTELWVKIRGENARKFSVEEYTGSYNIVLYFNNPDGILTPKELEEGKINTGLIFNLISKKHPLVLDKEPEGNADKWYDENYLGLAINPKNINGTKRYFLKVTFEDIDGKLEFNTLSGISNLLDSKILDQNNNDYLDINFINQVLSNTSMINDYIFNKDRVKREAYLYIPVKLLKPQDTYDVNIKDGVVANDSTESDNQPISWKFTTMAIPSVTDRDIIVQSVIEDYDIREPLIIQGDFFYTDTIDVYFNDIRADRVYLRNHGDKKYLEVYLPTGRDKLRPGLYNIVVENSENHKKTINSILSVVHRGTHAPEDGKRIKESNRYEELVEIVTRSEDVLSLNRYSRSDSIKLNLDELMSEETLVRRIEFLDGNSLKELRTYSKWVNVNIYDLYISGSRYDESFVDIGRVEPFLANNLKKSLQNYNIKSEMIQVVGSNVDFGRVDVEIPYERGLENRFKVLRYDEYTRRWIEESAYINNIDQKAAVTSTNSGIFVVVEFKY